jgi:glucokinase
MNLYGGLDFGGSSVKIGLVGEEGRIIARSIVEIDAGSGFKRIMTQVALSLERLLGRTQRKGRLVSLGVGTPGFTDKESGVLVDGCRNIPSLQGHSVRGYLERRFKVPVFADNDANCAAAGELLFGAGRRYRSFVMITIGTGIGGGIVLDGEVFKGSRGYAAELGHMCVDPNGPWCVCGNRGCFEQFSSGSAILRSYNERAEKRGIQPGRSARQVIEKARKGNRLAIVTIRDSATVIAQAFGTLLNILNVEAFIIGGGVSLAGDILLDPIRERLPDYCWPLLHGSVDIVQAELSKDAGIIGAAAQALASGGRWNRL